MNTFWGENGTKVLGALTAMLGTLSSLLSMGAFNELLTKPSIGWLSIFVSLATAGVGGTTMARGFNTSAQVKVAAAMEKAIMASPPQQGFARVLMMTLLIAIAAPIMLSLHGCAANQTTGRQEITAEGEAALQIAARIAVRHAIADSPRAAEKAANIRRIAEQVQGVLNAETTLGGLESLVNAEIDKLSISPLDKADAHDLLRLLTVALEARLGPDALNDDRVVEVRKYIDAIVQALPA